MERTVHESDHLRVCVDETKRVVRVVRNATVYPSIETAVSTLRNASEATRRLDRKRYGFVMDLREAQGRNDPAFESAIAAPRKALFEGYARRAVLVRTPAGRLQEQRLSRDGATLDVTIFSDEAEAITWASGG